MYEGERGKEREREMRWDERRLSSRSSSCSSSTSSSSRNGCVPPRDDRTVPPLDRTLGDSPSFLDHGRLVDNDSVGSGVGW